MSKVLKTYCSYFIQVLDLGNVILLQNCFRFKSDVHNYK